MKSYQQTQPRFYLFSGLAMMFLVFMMYHIQHYLLIPITDYTFIQYNLIFLFICFFVLCVLQFNQWLRLLMGISPLDEDDDLRQELKRLSAAELTQLVTNIFRSYGFKQQFKSTMSHELFYDVCLSDGDKRILICCKSYGDGQPVSQSFLDRLHLKQLKYEADEAYFISLSDYQDQCDSYATKQSLVLFNTDDVLTLLKPMLNEA